jgi:flavin reductase (DIM6/NTAB) family NADH-FMN oxidoreductase RutF
LPTIYEERAQLLTKPMTVSFEMIRKSRVCVINAPTADLVGKVVGIGNCSGDEVDKFKQFDLTPVTGAKVAAPLIRECFAILECRVADRTWLYCSCVLGGESC